MDSPNPLKRLWSNDEAAFGGWCASGSVFTAELMARQGFHFVGLDAQHGLFGYESIVQALVAVGGAACSPVVRMPSADSAAAGRILDAGAHGIIFPMVETAEQAAAAVSACRIHPRGTRSFGPIRASFAFGRDPQVVSDAAACIVMVETARAVENIEQIVEVDGIDCVYIGPGDLAITYGQTPGLNPIPGKHAQAIEQVRAACAARGVPVGIPCADADAALELASQGFRFLPVGADTWWLTAQSAATVSRLGLG